MGLSGPDLRPLPHPRPVPPYNTRDRRHVPNIRYPNFTKAATPRRCVVGLHLPNTRIAADLACRRPLTVWPRVWTERDHLRAALKHSASLVKRSHSAGSDRYAVLFTARRRWMSAGRTVPEWSSPGPLLRR